MALDRARRRIVSDGPSGNDRALYGRAGEALRKIVIRTSFFPSITAVNSGSAIREGLVASEYFADEDGWQAFLAGRLGQSPGICRWGISAGLTRTKRWIEAVLLDQTVIAGAGNIYADESCFAARIDPRRLASSLRPKEVERLLRSVQEVLDRAIESRGSSIRDYVGGSGERGSFQDRFNAYGRMRSRPSRAANRSPGCGSRGDRRVACPRCQK